MTDLPRRKFLAQTGVGFATLLSANVVPSVARAFQSDSAIRQFFNNGGNTVIAGIKPRNLKVIERIYSERFFAPLWTTDDHPTYTSVVVSQRLANAHLLGLEPSKYFGSLLNRLATESYQDNLLEFELLMTDSIVSYFDDIAHGATEPPSAKSGWRLDRARVDTSLITDDFFNGRQSLSETIELLHPAHHRFNRLLNALRDYQVIDDAGGWTHISKGPSLHPGDTSYRVAELRQRLLTSRDLPYDVSTDQQFFDTELASALIRFQDRHGLEADGVMGPKTRKALNVTVGKRIAELSLNLDRWRWLPRELGDSNITVNTAGYDMDVTLRGSVAMNMKVIVGKPKHATPLFSDSMEHMVFNPSWYVPRSIARKLLAKEAGRPGWLVNNNFEVRDKASNSAVPFSHLTPFDLDPEFFSAKYWLRQLPGDDNALGHLKFMFPNQYSIYLHDTNSPELFDEAERAFSHGCVRVSQPQELAELLLTADGHSHDDIVDYQSRSTTKTVNLRNPLPVHLTYQTAWVDDNGILHFRDDVYDHDQHALAQLTNNRTEYAQVETNATALTGMTLASNTY